MGHTGTTCGDRGEVIEYFCCIFSSLNSNVQMQVPLPRSLNLNASFCMYSTVLQLKIVQFPKKRTSQMSGSSSLSHTELRAYAQTGLPYRVLNNCVIMSLSVPNANINVG